MPDLLSADTLVKDDGFLSNALFSPDGKQILITGSPECLDGIGKNVKPNQVPSMVDMQLYLMDINGKHITPLTIDFNPNVQQAIWNTADKIHTPLLFLHGTTDMNVPTAQSVSMYTALKLLRWPTALVEVEGQGHHITDYDKRIRWQNTIWAWFAKYLQDDSTWWNAL